MTTNKPVCPTCYGRGWDMDCNEFRPATCPDCAGSGKAEHSITVQESDSATGLLYSPGPYVETRDQRADARGR